MSLPLAAGTYRLDQLHSQIGFTVTHLGITPVRGLFPQFEGELRVGRELSDTALEVSISMPSVQSGHAGRDEHLQVPDFFHSEAHPAMVFRSNSISEAEDGGWVIDGDLAVRGVTQPIRLRTAMTGRNVHPLDEKEHIGFVASGVLSRTAFGVAAEVPEGMLSDEIALDLSVQLIAD